MELNKVYKLFILSLTIGCIIYSCSSQMNMPVTRTIVKHDTIYNTKTEIKKIREDYGYLPKTENIQTNKVFENIYTNTKDINAIRYDIDDLKNQILNKLFLMTKDKDSLTKVIVSLRKELSDNTSLAKQEYLERIKNQKILSEDRKENIAIQKAQNLYTNIGFIIYLAVVIALLFLWFDYYRFKKLKLSKNNEP